MTARRRALLAIFAISVAAACDDNIRSHIYAGAQYEQAKGCLDSYATIDVVDGDDTGNQCAPVCLMNGGVYYVSTMCPPYPPLFAVTNGDGGAEAGVDPTCVAALAARAAGTVCRGDAGVAEGGSDAAAEGGDDGGGGDAPADAPTQG